MKKQLILGLAMVGSLAMTATPIGAQVGVSVRIGPPPPARVEVIPAAPGANYFWRPGHWDYVGSRYVWVGGAYIVRPRAGAVWIPGHLVQGPRRTFWVEGHWR
ncbi:MAG: YXWGXW repeat-containing protein [Candidatus Eremiobacteraeota bacterium]|nr:YXWGXW repeat-containing protein [Candidatus Eremiobacteraeota bacterium]